MLTKMEIFLDYSNAVSMKISTLTKKEYRISDWSGGKTTEVFLFPLGGRYQNGEFQYRLSTAQVEMASTTFSLLPGYQRLIMPIEQSLTLVHEISANESKLVKLEPFQSHYFDGGLKTVSYGKCTDFNLIYHPDYTGTMEPLIKEKPYFIESGKEYLLYALTDILVDIFEKNERVRCQHLLTGESLLFSEVTSKLVLTAIPKNKERTDPLAVWTAIKQKH